MILYRKVFPLGKGVSLSRYIKALEEKNFSPYTLLIQEIPGTENYHIEIEITDMVALWRFGSTFMLISDCTIQYSKGAREFTLQAPAGSKHIFSILGSVITALCGLLGMFFIIITRDISAEEVLAFLIIMAAVLAPITVTYIRDRNRLERIGLLALDLNKE